MIHWTRRLGTLSFVTVLVALALSMLGLVSPEVFDITFALAFAMTPLAFLPRIGVGIRGALGFSAALIAGVLIAWVLVPDVRFTPYLAIALTNAAVAYIFLRGQLPRRTPVILQIIALIGMAPVGSDPFRRFIYWQCWAWVFFGTITSLAGLAATVTPDVRPAAGVAITVLVIAQIAWFFLSHGYANWRYRRPETWRDTVRVMARPASWDALEV